MDYRQSNVHILVIFLTSLRRLSKPIYETNLVFNKIKIEQYVIEYADSDYFTIQWLKLWSVISHGQPDFQFDQTIFSWNLLKWPIIEWDYLESEVWQTPCGWYGKWIENEKLVNWILFLHATKFYEVKVDSFCMCKLLIKINIVQTQLWENL